MAEPAAPGVYVEEQKYALSSLRMDTRCLTGFVGIAERGPLHEPVLIESWDAYAAVFGGFDTPGSLPLSVYSFFKCGGSRCLIVRAANQEAARRARLSAVCCGGGELAFRAKSPGVWGNHISARIWHEGPRSGGPRAEAFSLSLSCKRKTETYLNLSLDPASGRWFVPYINSRSRFCCVENDGAKGLPKECFEIRAQGGADGIAEMSAGDFIGFYKGPGDYRGLGALECRDDVALVACPDAAWLLMQAGGSGEEKEEAFFAVQAAMVSQAERFPGRFAVLDTPPRCETGEAILWARRFATAAAALYYPAIDALDPLDAGGAKTVRIPPSGAVCGCIAATDSGRGIYHAPANVTVQGAASLAKRPSAAEQELLYAAGVNVLKYFPGAGIKIWGARTLCAEPAWRYINVRRTFTSISQGIKKGTHWAVFEPNTRELRKRLVRQVSGFLLELWMEGCLAGTTPEQAFFVRCDEELNPQENIDRGILAFEAGVAITRPAEFFRIFITAEKEGASVYAED
ncbi:MAG: phage tail sheath subtilisin-like domain-containing protein [Spirochaetales bacterium]|jgi:phage tail sheath protein FI|nr:phage tail sheath subtilisin-like domain-containing protein [Spirochaetales bacterium]